MVDFLGSNVSLDGLPPAIESKNTATNRFCGNKKKRRYLDTLGDSLSVSLSETVTGCCYKKLRKLENSLDVAICKRHNLIAKQLKNDCNARSVTKTLRLSLFNTVSIDEADQNENKWNLKMQAKVIGDGRMNPLEHIIAKIRIKMDGNEEIIEWNHRNLSDSGCLRTDGIEIERKGNKNCKVDIFIFLRHWHCSFGDQMDSNPNVCCFASDELAQFLGLRIESKHRHHSKSDILRCLAEYLRSNGLMKGDASMQIECNERLEALLGAKSVFFAKVWSKLVENGHITSPNPIHFEHEVKVTGDIRENAKFYDVLVRIPSFVGAECSKLMEASHALFGVDESHQSHSTIIDSLNVQISDVLEAIKHKSREAEICQKFANDPVAAIDVIVSNQRENLQIIQEFSSNAAPKSNQFWSNPSIYPDIKRYLKQKKLKKEQKAK